MTLYISLNGFTSRQKPGQKLWFWTKIQQTADEQYFHNTASKIWKTFDLLFAYFSSCTVFIVIQTHEVELQTCFSPQRPLILFSPVCSYASLVVDRWNPNVWNVAQRDLLHNYNYTYNYILHNYILSPTMTVGQANRGIIKFSWGLISKQCGIFLRLPWIKYKK